MLVKTSELTGAALDWAVAKSNGASVYFLEDFTAGEHRQFKPSTDWPQDTSIIAREGISIIRCNGLYFPKGNERGETFEPYFKADLPGNRMYGPTRLIAAMRCYVASKLGEEVEIPEELFQC